MSMIRFLMKNFHFIKIQVQETRRALKTITAIVAARESALTRRQTNNKLIPAITFHGSCPTTFLSVNFRFKCCQFVEEKAKTK